MSPIETIELDGGYVLKVFQDPDPERPEQESTVWIESKSRQFCPPLPRKMPGTDKCDSFPLYAYIHGGIALSLNPFSCPWDSGRIGTVYVARSEASADCPTERIAQGKVDEWNSYLSGERYGYQLESPEGEELDSCWGFDDLEYMKGEAMKAHAFHVKEDAETERMLAC
jgi:hypothetical protein